MSRSAYYLKRNPKGVYYIHWTEDRVGKRVSTRATDLDAAQDFLANWILMDSAAPAEGGDLMLEEVFGVYRKKHCEPKVAGLYNVDLAWKQMQPFFGSLVVSGLTQDKIDEYVTKRTLGRLGRKVKPHTAAKELSYLLAAIRFCADDRRRLVDPSYVRKYDLPAPGEPRDRWLRHDEIQALLDAAARLRRGDRMTRGERFLWLALETAGRLEALLDLTWDRVDFETGMITLDVPGRKRTKKRRAVVPMSKALRPVMERAYRERTGKLVLDNKGAIWATIQHIVMEAGLAPKQKVGAGQKPKATGISPHVLRHTAATHMARRGVSLWIIAKVLGNTIAVVERTYAKHIPDDLIEAVDKISNGALEAAE